MSKNFWQWYLFFFLYIFPLFFSFVGEWQWEAWPATISLIIGIVGWSWLIASQYQQYMLRPNRLAKEAQKLQKKGRLVEAKIKKIISKKETKEGNVETEINVSFPNLAGTEITSSFHFLDHKPHLNRYEVGKTIPIRLNTQKTIDIPWTIDAIDYLATKSIKRWLFLFSLVYAIVVFIGNYMIFSDGNGWRWVSLVHPWVWVPYTGLLIDFFMNTVLQRLKNGWNEKNLYELFLYGLQTTGQLTKIEPTGTYINEQPEMRMTIRYTDKEGKTHYIEKKRIVLLSDMSVFQVGEVKLLYLPGSPQTIEIL